MQHLHRVRPAVDRSPPSFATRAEPAIGARVLLERLRPAGNAAMTTLMQAAVQRQDADPAAPLLTPAQVKAARQYYTAQPARYTPAIVTQLRTALGIDPAGGVDDALALAVADWQATKGAVTLALVVDGKAGPRTLPRIFQHGLNVTGQGEKFGGEMQTGVVDAWATLATAEARRDALVKLVNKRLENAAVPTVTPAFDANPNNLGSFNFPSWTMRLGRAALDAPSLTEQDARDLADTVYHEARHTEQWFRMAQLRAAQGLEAPAIAAELGIQGTIAAKAKQAPLESGSMQALIAQGWWDSVYGPGSAHRDNVLTELDRAGTAQTKAQEKLDKDPTEANQKALDRANARRQKAFEGHEDLPEENDSWATGPAAAAGITGGSPAPAGAPPPADGPAHQIAPEANLPPGGP